MLYFTKVSDGKITAIYNSRFAFVRNKSTKDLKEMMESNQIIINEEFIHEKKHRILSSFSKTAAALNIYRFFTRLIFCSCKNNKIVVDYYKARSLYYKYMYITQEKLIVQDTLNKKEKIKNTDKLILEEWKNYKLSIRFFCFLPIYKVGKLFTKPYTIINGEWKGNNWNEEWLSDKGVLNDINNENKSDNYFSLTLKKTLNLVVIENLFKINYKDEYIWMINKFKTEKEFYSNNLSHSKFEIYLSEILAFVFDWLKVEITLLDKIKFQNLILSNIESKFISFPEMNKHNRIIIHFFYKHGN